MLELVGDTVYTSLGVRVNAVALRFRRSSPLVFLMVSILFAKWHFSSKGHITLQGFSCSSRLDTVGFKTYSSWHSIHCTQFKKPRSQTTNPISRLRNTWPPRDSKFPLISWVLLWCTSPTTLDFESSNCLEAWFVSWVPGCWWESNLSEIQLILVIVYPTTSPTGFERTSQVVEDFFHQQYHSIIWYLCIFMFWRYLKHTPQKFNISPHNLMSLEVVRWRFSFLYGNFSGANC